jgi:hypothetical protein
MFVEFYYHLSEILKKVRTNTDYDFNAYLFISIFQVLNFASLVIVLRYFFPFDVSKDNVIIFGISFWLMVGGFNFFALYRNRKKIFQKFSQQQLQRREKGKMLLWIYMILTNAVFFYLAFNLIKH